MSDAFEVLMRRVSAESRGIRVKDDNLLCQVYNDLPVSSVFASAAESIKSCKVWPSLFGVAFL